MVQFLLIILLSLLESEKTIFWEFDYDGENGINVEYVKYYSMVLKDGVHSRQKI
jgi:SHS2 domain-containing protein